MNSVSQIVDKFAAPFLGRRRNDRCYRVRGGLEFLGDDEEPLCHSMRTEAEVYRFTWRSGFDGDAAVRIGRQGDQITLHWIYRWYTLRRSNVITDSGGR